jgi:hypothetical protein
MRFSTAVFTARSVESLADGSFLVRLVETDVPAVGYEGLVSGIEPGDLLLVNTTAVEMGLGTGGYHFVIVNLTKPASRSADDGHIVKLRYTPLQHARPVVEELDAYRAGENETVTVDVFVTLLHSQIAPLVVALRKQAGRRRVCVIVDENCALPSSFSTNLAALKRKGYVDTVITAGNAFGGDLEAINRYSAIVAAKTVVEADAIVIGPGPGMPGTASTLGNGAVYAADAINAAAALGATAFLVTRGSAADRRERHRGVSHHTLTAARLALGATRIVLPDDASMAEFGNEVRELVTNALDELARLPRAEVVRVNVSGWRSLLENDTELMRTMGRGLAEDPLFFCLSVAPAYAVGGGGEGA